MANRDAKNEIVRDQLLKVQSLRLPFSIVGASSTQNVVVSQDNPSLLFIRTQGTDRITVSDGALVTGQSAPSYTAPNDSAGLFDVLVRVYEDVSKVLGAHMVQTNAAGATVKVCNLANTNAIGPNGDQICLNCTSGVNLTSATLSGYIVVDYINE